MKTHELKTWPRYYQDVASGVKPFELRLNDRKYEVGDILILKKWNPDLGHKGEYTGESLMKEVTCVFDDADFGIIEGFVCMGIKDVVR